MQAARRRPDDAFVLRALDLLVAEMPPARAAAVVAQLTGRHKAEVYALLAPNHAAEVSLMTSRPLTMISSMATRELLAELAAQYRARCRP